MALGQVGKYGVAAALGVGLTVSLYNCGGGEGNNFRNTVEHRLEASAVGGKVLSTKGMVLDTQAQSTPASVRAGEFAMALNLGAEDPDHPGNKLGAIAACTIATINAPNYVGKNHVLTDYSAALDSERSADDKTREHADGLYKQAIQACGGVVTSLAIGGETVQIPLGLGQ